jgi:hypothetical protein
MQQRMMLSRPPITTSVFFPFAKLCFIYQHAHEVTRVAAAAAAASA